MSDPREVLARYECCRGQCDPEHCMLTEGDYARASRRIAVLRAAGFRIVPVEPTPKMLRHAHWVRGSTPNYVTAVYRAMLAAAGADCQGCRLGWPLRRDTETGEMCHWADPRTNVGPCAAAGGSDGE